MVCLEGLHSVDLDNRAVLGAMWSGSTSLLKDAYLKIYNEYLKYVNPQSAQQKCSRWHSKFYKIIFRRK